MDESYACDGRETRRKAGAGARYALRNAMNEMTIDEAWSLARPKVRIGIGGFETHAAARRLAGKSGRLTRTSISR
jgi:hypothetical protein